MLKTISPTVAIIISLATLFIITFLLAQYVMPGLGFEEYCFGSPINNVPACDYTFIPKITHQYDSYYSILNISGWLISILLGLAIAAWVYFGLRFGSFWKYLINTITSLVIFTTATLITLLGFAMLSAAFPDYFSWLYTSGNRSGSYSCSPNSLCPQMVALPDYHYPTVLGIIAIIIIGLIASAAFLIMADTIRRRLMTALVLACLVAFTATGIMMYSYSSFIPRDLIMAYPLIVAVASLTLLFSFRRLRIWNITTALITLLAALPVILFTGTSLLLGG